MTGKALWLLSTRTGPAMVVRAACATCARNVACDNAGPEGTRYWREADCQRIHESGKAGVVLRRERDA